MTGPFRSPASALAARYLVAAALLSLGVGVALVIVAFLATGHVTGLDPIILLAVRARIGDSGPLIASARGVTLMGNNSTLWVVAAIGIGFFAIRQRWRPCTYFAVTTAGGAVLISVIKSVIDRPRPHVVAHLVQVHSASFPSGHAMDSAFAYGSLAFAVAADAGTNRHAKLIMIAAILLVLAIGVSRILLGVHWPTDVAAGWATGWCWTVMATRVFTFTEGRYPPAGPLARFSARIR
ncbi:phosphatase PAP2 family protein [Novosphingobium capsulatum]|uniref:phosphatase PAP2 family protein n=1 Tax=Novosphingobium capsulatum TaxID=13688 RepID=UPI00286AD4A1|nr:phosphatase PAP2 family protein [Novosphingobium capsulatum]